MARLLRGSKLRLLLVGATAVTATVGFNSYYEQIKEATESTTIVKSKEQWWK